MTGPEHFKAGQQLLKKSTGSSAIKGEAVAQATMQAQQAQAHFLAAQVAAVRGDDDWDSAFKEPLIG